MSQYAALIFRDNINQQIRAVGWVIQNKTYINLAAALGVFVRESQNDIGLTIDMIFAKAFNANLSVIRLS